MEFSSRQTRGVPSGSASNPGTTSRSAIAILRDIEQVVARLDAGSAVKDHMPDLLRCLSLLPTLLKQRSGKNEFVSALTKLQTAFETPEGEEKKRTIVYRLTYAVIPLRQSELDLLASAYELLDTLNRSEGFTPSEFAKEAMQCLKSVMGYTSSMLNLVFKIQHGTPGVDEVQANTVRESVLREIKSYASTLGSEIKNPDIPASLAETRRDRFHSSTFSITAMPRILEQQRAEESEAEAGGVPKDSNDTHVPTEVQPPRTEVARVIESVTRPVRAPLRPPEPVKVVEERPEEPQKPRAAVKRFETSRNTRKTRHKKPAGVRAAKAKVATEAPLDARDQRILELLGKDKPLREIGLDLKISAPGVTFRIKRLHKRGWVEKEPKGQYLKRLQTHGLSTESRINRLSQGYHWIPSKKSGIRLELPSPKRGEKPDITPEHKTPPYAKTKTSITHATTPAVTAHTTTNSSVKPSKEPRQHLSASQRSIAWHLNEKQQRILILLLRDKEKKEIAAEVGVTQAYVFYLEQRFERKGIIRREVIPEWASYFKRKGKSGAETLEKLKRVKGATHWVLAESPYRKRNGGPVVNVPENQLRIAYDIMSDDLAAVIFEMPVEELRLRWRAIGLDPAKANSIGRIATDLDAQIGAKHARLDELDEQVAAAEKKILELKGIIRPLPKSGNAT